MKRLTFWVFAVPSIEREGVEELDHLSLQRRWVHVRLLHHGHHSRVVGISAKVGRVRHLLCRERCVPDLDVRRQLIVPTGVGVGQRLERLSCWMISAVYRKHDELVILARRLITLKDVGHRLIRVNPIPNS